MHLFQAGTLSHSGCDTDNRCILLGQIHQCPGKDIGIGWWISRVFLDDASRIIKSAGSMPLGRVFFRVFPTFALLGHHLDHHWPFNLFDILKDIQQERNIVPVKRAKKLEAEFFKDHAAFTM